MRFDPELMRDILQYVENLPAGEALNGTIASEERAQAEINGHIQLLLDDGYLQGLALKDSMGFPFRFSIRGLTMKGHQFAANARNDTLWKKVLQQAKERGQSIAITILDGMLQQAAKKFAGLE